jgi:phage-related minor tail protein
MGEAGSEAILPLKRTKQGKLGVESSGGGGNVVNVSVDAGGTSAQGNTMKANQLGKLIGTAIEAELIKQKRPGGILYD